MWRPNRPAMVSCPCLAHAHLPQALSRVVVPGRPALGLQICGLLLLPAAGWPRHRRFGSERGARIRAAATREAVIDGSEVVIRRLTQEHELDVELIQGLFQPLELEELVALCDARQGFQASKQTLPSGEFITDERRTSSSCPMLWPLMMPPEGLSQLPPAARGGVEAELQAVLRVQRRCAEVIGVEEGRIEPLQLVRYLPDQYYRPHMDTHEEPHRMSSYAGEQRSHTMLVFLSDVPEDDGGGHLHFPKLGLKVLPQAGEAVLWQNLRDGQPDPRALHEGVAPTSCQKLVMNVWVADRPFSIAAIAAWGRRQKEMQPEPQPTTSQFLD
ncbi:unnamed protein product [Effrenium voratum]|uniref:Fe2OG dioxygenase domain-containing protein n=1 Tax=Effrenium voratum TaxID=2562239 RepID=A0AA36J329_9DINO|nr:unnamed protein product [Effrenium voratum]CAJ1437439.1 unnamed protein product [Effrenium voratum]